MEVPRPISSRMTRLSRRRLGEDRRGLDHLDHEGRTAAREIVGGADAAEQAVDDADPRARGRDEAAGLGEHRDQRGLAEEGRLAAHVGAGDQPQPVVRAQREVVGDEALAAVAQRGFDHRVPAPLDFEARLVGRAAAASSRPPRRDGRGLRRRRCRAMASAVAVICGAAATASAVSSSACAASAASAWPPASITRLASSCSSGELKRTTPASVWRWVKPLSGPSACRRAARTLRHDSRARRCAGSSVS